MPLHGFVNDRGTHGFVKLTHLFGGFFHRFLHLLDKGHAPFRVHREVTGHGGHLEQQVGTQAQIDGHTLNVEKLQAVVIRSYVQVKAVVAAQAGYVVQQVGKLFQ